MTVQFDAAELRAAERPTIEFPTINLGGQPAGKVCEATHT